MKLEQIVGRLRSRLAGKDEHGISSDGDGEIAARGRRVAVTFLRHFLPMHGAWRQRNRPHVVEPRIAVVTRKNPQLGVIDAGAVSGASNGDATCERESARDREI